MTEAGHDLSSFGELLKVLRKRRSLTQQQLAQALGVHRSAIVRWEQGDVLPNSKAMVLELARHLHLDDQETRHLLEASLTSLAPHWSVPLPRNPYFTGREEVLEALYTQLGTHQAATLTHSSALYGLGGIGKTQIALEYAYRHALEYRAVFWIRAETEENVIASLLRVAEALQLPGRDDKDQQRVAAAVQRWLGTHSQWLLIWDNLEDLDLLPRFLPSPRSGAVLITTRNAAPGTCARGLALVPMGQEEGFLLLLRRAKVLPPEAGSQQIRLFARQFPAEYAAAEHLLDLMGGLPLALDQAGAYLEETICSLAGYLRRYEQQRQRLLDRRGRSAGDHPSSVAATLWLACQQVARRHPGALELLSCCAFVAPDAIPEELFLQGSAALGPVLGPLAADPYQLDQAIAALRDLSLVQRQPEMQTLSIHRLVQVVLREQIPEPEQNVWVKRVIAALCSAFPEVTYEAWGTCERLISHVMAATSALPDQMGDQVSVEVLRKAADYFYERAQYEQAEQVYRRAGEMGERVLGTEHPGLAALLHGLARLSLRQGKYTEAQALLQRAIQLWERTRGAEHPDLARSLHYLAELYREQGRYRQAEPLYQRALSIRERVLGPEHPDVAFSLNDLAFLWYEQGLYAQAEPLYQRALAIWEKQVGPEHPEVATVLNNLALLSYEQGRLAQAEALDQRALSIRERALGPEHPDVAITLNNLALFAIEQEHYTRAQALCQQARCIWERAFGAEHPDVAVALNNLALLAARQQHYARAEVLYLQAWRIREQVLGVEHPDTARSLNRLANLYREEDQYERAASLYQRVLWLRMQVLGKHHPETAETLSDFALLRQKQGHLSEALSLAECALLIRSQTLGGAHPKTIATQTLHAQLVQAQGGLEMEGSSSEHQTEPRTLSRGQEHLPNDMMNVAVRGGTEEVAYTRHVQMREVTFTCTICGQTVTQWHYPSGRIKYCSEACRATGDAQIQEERVRKQREKRRTERAAHLRTQQGENL